MVSTIYNPLGFVSPLLLPAKMLLQELCRQKMGWDEKINESLDRQWKLWLDTLDEISEVTIDCCFIPDFLGKPYRAELHHFSDASERGYSVVSYLRVVDTNDCTFCNIARGKSRVTPLKTVSIPRLALLLSYSTSEMRTKGFRTSRPARLHSLEKTHPWINGIIEKVR